MTEHKPELHKGLHNFLIYFCLWAFAAVQIIVGIRKICGVLENGYQYQVPAILISLVLIASGLLTVKIRFDLAAMREKVLKEILIVSFTVPAVLIIGMILTDLCGEYVEWNLLAYVIFSLGWGIGLYRYYQSRGHLFREY